MAEANLRWKADTAAAEAQILALKGVIESIGGRSTTTSIGRTTGEIKKLGNEGEHGLSRLRRGFEGLGQKLVYVGANLAAVVAGFASMATSGTAVVASLVAIAAVLATIAALAAPIVLAMGAITALGALGNVFKIQKGKIVLIGEFKKVLVDLFHTVHDLAKTVTKPLFAFLLAELHQLDKWVHTEEFKKGMQEIGRMLPKVAKAIIGAAKSIVTWYIQNWPTIKVILLDTLVAFGAVATAVKWLAKQFERYFPTIKHAAQVAFNWFMRNLYPGLSRAFHGIAQIVAALAKGFQQAWPQISAALKTAWQIIHPILDMIASALGKVQDALNWLAQHSGGAISALAGAINSTLGGVQAIIGGVSSALSTLVSALQTARGLLGGSSNGVNGTSGFGGGRFGGVIHPATGGLVTGGIPGADSVPAMLTPGELVLTKRQQLSLLRGGGRGPTQVNLVLDRRVVASVLVDADKNYRRQNAGRSLFAV